MQLSANQLDLHLSKTISPIYLISGDELLCVEDARNNIIIAAKKHHFEEKNIFFMDARYEAAQLADALFSQNLFSEKVIIDIRNEAGKWDAETVSAIEKYLLSQRSDRLIIMTTKTLSAAAQKSVWYELIKKQGVTLPIWPIKMNALPQWIAMRAKKYALNLSAENVRFLAHFCEGNLLAADQALIKIQLMYPNQIITEKELRHILADHAQFGLFDLSDALMQKNIKKSLRILKKLEQSGEEPPLVLWAICRAIRNTQNPLLSQSQKNALQCAAHADEIIKGGKIGDVWQALSSIITEQLV